jgi:hypothetical protein
MNRYTARGQVRSDIEGRRAVLRHGPDQGAILPATRADRPSAVRVRADDLIGARMARWIAATVNPVAREFDFKQSKIEQAPAPGTPSLRPRRSDPRNPVGGMQCIHEFLGVAHIFVHHAIAKHPKFGPVGRRAHPTQAFGPIQVFEYRAQRFEQPLEEPRQQGNRQRVL